MRGRGGNGGASPRWPRRGRRPRMSRARGTGIGRPPRARTGGGRCTVPSRRDARSRGDGGRWRLVGHASEAKGQTLLALSSQSLSVSVSRSPVMQLAKTQSGLLPLCPFPEPPSHRHRQPACITASPSSFRPLVSPPPRTSISDTALPTVMKLRTACTLKGRMLAWSCLRQSQQCVWIPPQWDQRVYIEAALTLAASPAR